MCYVQMGSIMQMVSARFALTDRTLRLQNAHLRQTVPISLIMAGE